MSRRKQRYPFHLTGDECESSQVLTEKHANLITKIVSQFNHKMGDEHTTMSDEVENNHAQDKKCPEINSASRDVSPSPSSSPNVPSRSNSPDNPTDRESYNSGQRVPDGEKLTLKCPLCQRSFDNILSFKSHVYDHCQETTLAGSLKREGENTDFSLSKKLRTSVDIPPHIKISRDCHSDPETYLPLDLSCNRLMGHTDGDVASCKRKRLQSSDSVASGFQTNGIKMSMEEENLANEAREHEKSFFNASNELYLTEDSSGFDASPILPLYHSGGATRQVTVCGDEGSPMVYKIKLHSEQMLVSRILGVNQETGNKIELYKCFLCSLSFPSISRLQAHLIYHKQRFVCKMCNYSCDTRALFAQHVQKLHLAKFSESRSRQLDQSEDLSSAENTVTVAALLSALREKSSNPRSISEIVPNTYTDMEDGRKSESTSPISPSSESQESLDNREHNGETFKGYSCRFCNKRFDRAFSCNRHERVHTGFKPCYCNFCGRGFSEPRNLRHHVIRFHSDGSLRHLIKRDRRKRGDEYCGTSLSPVPLLKSALQGSPDNELTNFVNNIDSAHFNLNLGFDPNQDQKPLRIEDNVRRKTMPSYTKNLSKMFYASFDSKAKSRGGSDVSLRNGDSYRNQHSENNNDLEPGEIRFKIGTKVIDDGERGRRLIMSEDNSDDIMDHSPQFSSYAPRLNIVQDRINREKALAPITDDIGRTFYECPYCRKLFGSTSDLNRHLDFHEDLRPYDCDYCSYSARTNSQLKVHKMRHEGIKQYTCDVCNYNGVTQSDLNRHKKTQSHTARSHNICSVCGLGFYSHSQKQVHIVQCHPEMEGASSLIQMSLGVPLVCKESSESSHSPTDLTSVPN